MTERLYSLSPIWFASREFWIFNALAWIFYALLISIIASMGLDTFNGALKKNLYTAVCGFFYCYGLRALSIHWRWFELHPLKHIPLICILALAFAAVDSVIHFSHLILIMPTTCLFSSEPPASYQCGFVVNIFFERTYAIVVWGMLYLYIQSERHHKRTDKITRGQLVAGILALLGIKVTSELSTALAWSHQIIFLTFIYLFVHLLFTILFARVILLVKLREKFLGSQLIPLIPTFLMLVFCLGVVEIITGNIAFRGIRYLLTGYHSDQPSILLFILLGGADGNWRSAGELGGPLFGSCRDIAVVALFLISSRMTKTKALLTPSHLLNIDFSRTLHFWIYNLNGWFVIATCLYFFDIFGLNVVAPVMPAAFSVSFFISGVCMGGMIRSTLRNHSFDDSGFIPLASRVFLISLALGVMQACVIWFCNHIYIYLALAKDDPYKYAYFMTYTYHFLYSCALCTVAFVLWSLAYEISISQREKVNAKMKQLQLENNIKQLQLNALAGKIDPHFIFNALNNIRYLVRVDVERAREALLVLSDILRNPIAKSTSDKVLVSEELTLVRHYINLSKIHFEQNLHYEEMVDQAIKNALIPPMMLQILIENAIKHGISQLPDGGVLRLSVMEKNKKLYCEVINTGELSEQSTTAGFGVGIKNISERLLLLYGQSAYFSLKQNGNTVIAELGLPLEFSL